jgi:hypothetical protein
MQYTIRCFVVGKKTELFQMHCNCFHVLVEERVVKLKSRFVLARAMFLSHLDKQYPKADTSLPQACTQHR